MLATDIGSGGKAVASKREAGTGLALSFALDVVDVRERLGAWVGCTESALKDYSRVSLILWHGHSRTGTGSAFGWSQSMSCPNHPALTCSLHSRRPEGYSPNFFRRASRSLPRLTRGQAPSLCSAYREKPSELQLFGQRASVRYAPSRHGLPEI